jgi:DNA (cytosine-5)-methyltransferase 1
MKVPEQLPLLRKQQNGAVSTLSPLSAVGLFAGIGGIELGLGRAGHESLLLCEIEQGARAVLDARFPGVAKKDDVTTLRALPVETELLAAGFPCQDLSQAGKTVGIEGSRSGLIGEVFRLIRRKRVQWLLIENVPFMLRLARGQALEVIVTTLEELGYRWAYRVVNSRSFGVPQRRERVYLVASQDHDPRSVLLVDDACEPRDDRTFRQVACGFYWTEGIRGLGWAVDSVPTLKGGSTIGIPSPPAIILPNGEVVKPDIRDAERMQGFDADWTQPAESVMRRGHRWKLVGNAVTVDAAHWIGTRLRNPGEYDTFGDVPLKPGDPWPDAAWNVGSGRFSADVSTYPIAGAPNPLMEFVKFPFEPLSARATAGFLERARRSSLRFPKGFIEALEAHLSRVSDAPIRAAI